MYARGAEAGVRFMLLWSLARERSITACSFDHAVLSIRPFGSTSRMLQELKTVYYYRVLAMYM